MQLRLILLFLFCLLILASDSDSTWASSASGCVNRCGFIDTQGGFAIKPQFLSARNFSEGIAWVQCVTKTESNPARYTAIDTSGRVLFACDTNDASDFHCGLAKVAQGDRYGFIDRRGKFVIAPDLNGADDFCNGESTIFDANWERKRIDCRGHVFDYVEKTGGLRPLNPFGSVAADGHGKQIFQPSGLCGDHQKRWGVYSEGLCHVSFSVKGDDRTYEGFINEAKQLVLVLPPEIEDCGNFHEGLAPAVFKPGFFAQCLGDKQLKLGFVNRHGAVVIPDLYDEPAGSSWDPIEQVAFHSGVALVQLKGVNRYIDRNGMTVADFPNALCEDFSEGLAVVNLAVDANGRPVQLSTQP